MGLEMNEIDGSIDPVKEVERLNKYIDELIRSQEQYVIKARIEELEKVIHRIYKNQEIKDYLEELKKGLT